MIDPSSLSCSPPAVRRGSTNFTAARRSAGPGVRKSTMMRSRRRNRSRGPLAVRGQDGDAVEGLHALQQVVDLDVGVAVVRVLDLAALAERASASSNRSITWLRSHGSKTRGERFSVSPMYLLTTSARSTRYRSSSSERASTCAAIVLPVPLGPANSAATPAVAGHRFRNPGTGRTARAGGVQLAPQRLRLSARLPGVGAARPRHPAALRGLLRRRAAARRGGRAGIR